MNEQASSQFSSLMQQTPFGENATGTQQLLRKLAGVAEGMKELEGRVAGESNQDFLNAVSFHKGCYLGQELTARVQYTGAIRKRIVPCMLIDVNMQIPRPWLLASQLQNTKEEPKADEPKETEEATVPLSGEIPRLPRLSAPAVASMIGVMSGFALEDVEEEKKEEQTKFVEQSEALMERLQEGIRIGESMTQDGKTIGKIVSTPEPGTNVILAQMRLDALGLLGDKTWLHTNKVQIGNQEYRYLPYLPLWWPELDRSTGKAKEPDEEEEEEADELP